MPPLLLSICLFAIAVSLVSSTSSECNNRSAGECLNEENECLDPSAFQRRVSSFEEDESVLTLLRGTAESIISQDDIDALIESLPMSEFAEGAGYDESNNRDGRAYNAPVAYAGLGLKELSTSHESRYNKLLEIREKVRSTTERNLNLCPGSLLVDFTTISQKTVGGAHTAHADNCLHYFDAKKKAKCDPTREHPYPKRVAASILYLNNHTSGNFADGEFYFANRGNGDVDETIPVEAGKMIYFTSGLENLHGALPVQRRIDSSDDDDGAEPRRLALAMWYVTDPELEEYVPTFQEVKKQSPKENSDAQSRTKPRKVYDPNDPNAPKELFTVPIPKSIDIDTLFESMGAYLVSKLQKNGQQNKQWQVIKGDTDLLHVLFEDHSAMFSLDFGVALDEKSTVQQHAESSVVVERHTDGRKRASLQYMLQESVLLHVVLDGFMTVMAEKLNEVEGQYLKGEVNKARDTLPARQA
ncbi:hypothetical protein ACHAXR_007881 [Thalassiosira sp. AJA248-18]